MKVFLDFDEVMAVIYETGDRQKVARQQIMDWLWTQVKRD